jgi:hypothetical protein
VLSAAVGTGFGRSYPCEVSVERDEVCLHAMKTILGPSFEQRNIASCGNGRIARLRARALA